MDTLTNKVNDICLESVLQRVKYNTGMDEQTLSKAEQLYRQFLILCAKYPEQRLVPPKLADEVWHEHITATKQYQSDCKDVFGDYLHHNTDLPQEVLDMGWRNSQNLYNKEFSVDLVLQGLEAGPCAD